MARRFDAFVLLAEMRTGSNALEASLNGFPDIDCLGEVYNPTFLGHHNRFEMLGYDMARRERDPLGLLQAIIERTDGLPGFRLFHDHDDRVVARVLPDPRIAKVILTRNPLDSYVSRKIATETGQWRLTDMKDARSARIRFDADEFLGLLDRQAAFRDRVRRGLQATGQAAFAIRYEDINEVEVVNGLAAFLGSGHRIDTVSGRLKKQNPGPLRDRVENYDDLVAAIGDLDRFGLERAPDLEPERPAHLPGLVVHPLRPLLFCPVKGAPEQAVLDWMGRLDGVGRDALIRTPARRDLRDWMKGNPGFRSFTVLRHPLLRAHSVFNRTVLPDDRPRHSEVRRILRQRYGLPLPAGMPGADWTRDAQKAAFAGFLDFLKGNLAGQTSLPVAPAWASQTAILQGMARVLLPQAVVLEDDMATALPGIARSVGADVVPEVEAEPAPGPFALSEILDGRIEQRGIDIYRQDYLGFGFARRPRR